MRTRTRYTASGVIALALSIIATLIVGPTSATAATATNNPDFSANVMAPLEVSNWTEFSNQLATVEAYGVDAVTVDVWWGKVEAAGDNQFNWSYYDQIFQVITSRGLDIVPIFSFHQCGGNVGDTCNIPLPSWLWGKYTGATLNGVTLDANGLKHRSEQGNYSNETVQGWATQLVQNEYQAFTQAFVARYGTTYATRMQEINVSLGPAGELRYPSYNSHDSGTGYPTRGALQAYSPLAIKSFQQWALAKYSTLAGINAAWGSTVTTITQVQPPSNAGFFFSSGDYRTTQYGKDLIDWYNKSLVDHGERMLDTVLAALGSSFPGAEIGYKIPGVHWSMTGPTPRAAEVAAGLIQTSVGMYAVNTGRGYANIVGLANRVADSGRGVILHFTCLEFNDENFAPQFSQAKTLVGWVGAEAGRQGVKIKGENALAGGITSNNGWDNVNQAFDNSPYLGMTVLRVGEVASGTGATRYAQFIQKYRPAGSAWNSLYVRGTNNGWGLGTPMVKSGNVWTAMNVSFGAAANQRFKFDVRGDWSLNYGGSGLSGTAVQSGGDIAVASNTTYTITFNEVTKVYAATPSSQPPQGSAVTVHFAEWQSASSYSIHTWNGVSGTFPMVYEGFINGRHWWKVTLSNAPSSFGFTFTNSNGNWDTADRAYASQASTIYVLPGNATVFTSRP
ncbi:family 14 glycosylhydrolase [Microcella sp.]|uniref:family 14 glycosylhydrolase n=1 Tax=Microcella sp. TaxID=1913979 RepID=UPI003F70B3D3